MDTKTPGNTKNSPRLKVLIIILSVLLVLSAGGIAGNNETGLHGSGTGASGTDAEQSADGENGSTGLFPAPDKTPDRTVNRTPSRTPYRTVKTTRQTTPMNRRTVQTPEATQQTMIPQTAVPRTAIPRTSVPGPEVSQTAQTPDFSRGTAFQPFPQFIRRKKVPLSAESGTLMPYETQERVKKTVRWTVFRGNPRRGFPLNFLFMCAIFQSGLAFSTGSG